MENVLSRLTNLKALQFLPQVKKEVDEKNKSIDLNRMIREELEVDKQGRDIGVSLNIE